MKSKIILKSIGKVQNDFREDNIGKHLARRVLMLSRLVIDGRFKAALEGIESYSHLIIIYYMHKVTGTKGLKINSQGRKEIAKVGFFATRSPNRPNPIGVTVVKLLERRQNIVKIRGLYAINGTPILDIKPYTYTDRKGTIRVPVCERRIFYKDS